MKIIQTFWSGNQKTGSALNIKAGWISPEFHWMSWTLSCLLLRRLYDRVELYTDEIGKKILIDILHLPYTDVHIVFDDSFNIHNELFSLAKIHTYSLQEEPFIHIDGDLFLWKPFSSSIHKADLISSNLEINLFFNREILLNTEKKLEFIPNYLRGVGQHKNVYSSNAGIFGGKNLNFIKKYCDEASNFIELNKSELDEVNMVSLNFLFEQISLYYFSKEKRVPVTYYMTKPVIHPLYQEYIRFIDVPYVEMVHLVGGCKRLPYVLNHLTKRLRLESPKYYYKIIKILQEEGINFYLELYNHCNIADELASALPFNHLNPFKSSLGKLALIDFRNSFRRSLKAIEYYYSKKLVNHSELSDLATNDIAPKQIKEIYILEKQSSEKFTHLIKKIEKDNLYKNYCENVDESSRFHFDNGWMDKEIAFQKGVTILNLGWDWGNYSTELNKDFFDEILNSKESNYLVTLNYDIVNLAINETYYNGLDALILKIANKPTSIKEIAIEAIEHFNDDISLDTIDYQKLLFDTIKRLLHNDIIYIK